jgi:hypothetical protein
MPICGKAAVARERLRRRYRPTPVRLLFVGEAPATDASWQSTSEVRPASREVQNGDASA